MLHIQSCASTRAEWHEQIAPPTREQEEEGQKRLHQDNKQQLFPHAIFEAKASEFAIEVSDAKADMEAKVRPGGEGGGEGGDP